MDLKNVILSSAFLAVCFIVTGSSWSHSNVIVAGSEEGLPLTASMVAGAREAVAECRRQFAYDRWHCPFSAFTNMIDKEPATREQAFVHAITSASITNTITRNCSRGQLEDCSCSHGRKNWRKFKWEGCSDDVSYADAVTKEFFDVRISGQDARALVNLHNLQVGRIVVRRSLRRSCKCHGLSGSCTTKSCWLQLQDFATIARKLKKNYRKAMKLTDTNKGLVAEGPFRRSANCTFKGKGPGDGVDHQDMYPVRRDSIEYRRLRDAKDSSVESHDCHFRDDYDYDYDFVDDSDDEGAAIPYIDPRRFVYIADSPDFCQVNRTAGWPGTLGRVCLEAVAGEEVFESQLEPCRVLCHQCGYSVSRMATSVPFKCNCKFKWCCRVECESCAQRKVRYTCTQNFADFR